MTYTAYSQSAQMVFAVTSSEAASSQGQEVEPPPNRPHIENRRVPIDTKPISHRKPTGPNRHKTDLTSKTDGSQSTQNRSHIENRRVPIDTKPISHRKPTGPNRHKTDLTSKTDGSQPTPNRPHIENRRVPIDTKPTSHRNRRVPIDTKPTSHRKPTGPNRHQTDLTSKTDGSQPTPNRPHIENQRVPIDLNRPHPETGGSQSTPNRSHIENRRVPIDPQPTSPRTGGSQSTLNRPHPETGNRNGGIAPLWGEVHLHPLLLYGSRHHFLGKII